MNRILTGLMAVVVTLAGFTENVFADGSHSGANSISEVKRATYTIKKDEDSRIGSGILIDKYLMVTAWHVVDGVYEDVPENEWHTVEVYVQRNTRGTLTRARLLKRDIEHDIALLETVRTACPCVNLSSERITDEDMLYASYNLNGIHRPIFLRGYVIENAFNYISTSIPVHLGASGGGLYLKSGDAYELVGVIRSIPMSNGNVLGYMSNSTPIRFVKRLLEE